MPLAFCVEEVIDRPAEIVWAALTDWDSAPRWMAGIDKMRTNGETAVGTKLTFLARGKERSSTIQECRPGHEIVLRSVQGGVTADYRYEITPTAAGATRVRLTARCDMRGLHWRLFAPLLRIAMRRVDGSQLANLRKALEENR